MNIRGYILKVWVSSIVAAPILLAMAAFLSNMLKGKPIRMDDFTPGIGVYIILLGFILSLPALLLVLLFSSLLVKFIHKPVQVKGLLFAIELVLIVITMRVVFGSVAFSSSSHYSGLVFSGVCVVANTIFSFVYKLAPKNDSPGEG